MHAYRVLGVSMAVGLSLAGVSAARAQQQPVAPSAASTANYIEGAVWTYPGLRDIYAYTNNADANANIDCAILPSGHVTDCTVLPVDKPADQRTLNAIGAAYLRHAVVDLKSIDGGVQPGDRVRFHYDWHNLPDSDLADASSLPRLPQPDKDPSRYAHSVWTYPSVSVMADAYPAQAQADGFGDTVVIYCTIGRDGHMTACKVIYDMLPALDFGHATAAAFLKYCHVDPATVEGGIEDGDYKVFTYIWTIR